MSKIDAVVVHSGGMDSSICLAQAVALFGPGDVLSLGFSYGQRQHDELERGARIANHLAVRRAIVSLRCLAEITTNALTDHSLEIEHQDGEPPNTLVVGRNGLMARVGAIHANHLGARCIYMGIIEVESANSGYRDCTRAYMDVVEAALRLDFDDPDFEIRTPLVGMTKRETLEEADRLGVLEFLLDETITCYRGVPHAGCGACPACDLRNEGIREFMELHPGFELPYPLPSSS